MPAAAFVSSAAPASSVPSALKWSVPLTTRAAAAPMMADGRIFVVLESGHVVAYGGTDGREAWRVELRSDQPVGVERDRIFVTSGEALYALNAETGAPLWHTPTGTLTAPVLAHEGWIITASAKALAALRASDGGTVWSRESGAQHERPTIEGDNLYVPLDAGQLLALDLRTGSARWAKHFAGAPTEVLALADRIYFGSADKYFYCLETANGDIDWRTRIGTTLRGRPVASAARIFVAGTDNVVRAFDRVSGALRWHVAVPYRPAGLILVGSAVLVPGTSAELRGFDATTGKPAGQIALTEQLAVPPAFGQSGKEVVMAAITGTISGEWKLLLTEPTVPAPPAIAIEPLASTLPGTIVPLQAPDPKR
jgi:outer membrane protein assembly factor BamB